MAIILEAINTQIEPEPARLPDGRFQDLLTKEEWENLPEPVQKRFSRRVKGGATIVYVGKIRVMKMNRLGRVLTNLLRPFGAPLPLYCDVGTPSVVSVTEDASTGGQIWTRLYANRHGFPQMVHSAKRFSGPTGLEEYIGYGVSIALKVRARGKRLSFESAGFYCKLFGKKIRIPRALMPLDLVVTHEACGRDWFTFSLNLTAPLFGTLIYQEGLYGEEQQ
ncbi:MAG: DUF4166 domain-containing protein [Pseudomonadota bacterium]